MCIQALAQKAAPVVRLHCLQGIDDVVKLVADNLRTAILDAVECVEKIVEGARIVGQFADARIDIQPD